MRRAQGRLLRCPRRKTADLHGHEGPHRGMAAQAPAVFSLALAPGSVPEGGNNRLGPCYGDMADDADAHHPTAGQYRRATPKPGRLIRKPYAKLCFQDHIDRLL